MILNVEQWPELYEHSFVNNNYIYNLFDKTTKEVKWQEILLHQFKMVNLISIPAIIQLPELTTKAEWIRKCFLGDRFSTIM